ASGVPALTRPAAGTDRRLPPLEARGDNRRHEMTTLAANHASADSRRRQVLGVAARAGTAAVGLTAWAVARSPILVEPASGALVRSLYVALTIAVGTYIWSRQPAGRFGRLLAFLGLLYALTSLNASGRPALYT